MLLNEFTSGQFFVKAPLLAEEVEALKKSLNEKMSDTAQDGDVLLKLAKHNLDKINIRAEEISDLDSAETYISIAKEVNSRQPGTRKYDGSYLFV